MNDIFYCMCCLIFAIILINSCSLSPAKRMITLIAFLLFPVFCKAQKISGPIVLNDQQFLFSATEFHIADVVDERDDRSVIARLLPAGLINETTPKYTLDLKDGASLAIRQFTSRNLVTNKASRAIIIHIKKLQLDETLQAGGRVNGKLNVVFSFTLRRGENDIQLIGYKASSNYTRTSAQQMDVGGMLSNAIQSGLIYFNTWINKEADTNIKLVKGVKLVFTDYTEQPEGDTIYYSAKRPIKWSDFQQRPPASKFEAEVFPSFGYAEEVEIVKGIINVHLSLKAYLPKSACWVKEGAQTAYNLNHEQRHFDIVKIVAMHFKKQLLKEKLTVENYDGPINVQYFDSFKEMNDMQKQYDDETNHGINHYVQEQWDKKIDKELGR